MMRFFGLSAVVLMLGACHPDEGERCNPMLFTDECARGLACTVPAGCAVAFCCPTSRASTNFNCQPCPSMDAGASD